MRKEKPASSDYLPGYREALGEFMENDASFHDSQSLLLVSGLRFSAGLDGKASLTNDLTLDFTFNPDFGQVEADPSEVNLTAFETYFSERRPFFIEGKNIYEFAPNQTIVINKMQSDNLFYSRRIGRFPHGYPETAANEYVDMPETFVRFKC